MATKTMQDIEELTASYSAHQEKLADFVETLNRQMSDFKREKRDELKSLATAAANSKASLRAAIDEAPELFEKPKTQMLHGVKVGYRKLPRKLSWLQSKTTSICDKIRQQYDDQIGILINTMLVPNKEALERLADKDLRALGVKVIAASQEVVVKPMQTDVDKLVNALLDGEVVGEES